MTEQTEREVLEALWDRVDMRGYAIRARFTAMLDAEAYLDAALMLVPENVVIERLRLWPNQGALCVLLGTHDIDGERWHHISDGRWEGEGTSISAALCAAIEAAIARAGE